MVSAKIVASAAVLLAASSVSALGNAVVQNSCAFDVYLWSVSDVSGPMVTVAAGGEYTESYQTNPNGGGVSIKLATSTAGSNVTQYEYTLESSDLWYDVSNINGYPFVDYGLTLIPSVSTCRSIICPAGTALCADAYNTPDENYATAECASTADIVLVLCSGDTTTSPDASVSAVASAVETTTAVPSATSAHFASTTAYNSTLVHTTFMTTVVTVQATSAAAVAASTTPVEAATTTAEVDQPWWSQRFGSKERRAGHIHRHAHAHGHQA